MAQYKVSLWDTTRDAPLPLITELAAASDWLGYWQRLCYFSCSSYSIFFWDSSWIPSKASLRLHLLLYSIRRLHCILTKALLILLLLFLMRSFIWDSPWVLFRVLLLLLFLLFLRRKLALYLLSAYFFGYWLNLYNSSSSFSSLFFLIRFSLDSF